MKIKSIGIPLAIQNIDTDQLVPASFLKLTTKEGYGKYLLYNWRYTKDFEPNPDFVLNQKAYKDGQIIIAGNNFGCGSSREHAAWALKDYGFKVILSTNFADIFRNNALNNGLLPIELSSEFYHELKTAFLNNHELKIKVNLEEQEVSFHDKTELFQIDTFKKHCILHGKDELDFLIDHKEEINIFEHA